MKKILISALVLFISISSFAGDYLTNTNQSVKFLRNPARQAAIGIDGVYYNPAGVSFLKDGFHVQFNWQVPFQTRNSKSSYGQLFGANYLNPGTKEADGSFSRLFKGKANVPIQPSLYMAYNVQGWSFQLGFNVVGGGGKCKFKSGIGVLEALVGQNGITTLGANFGGYSLTNYVEGKSLYYGLTLTAAKTVTDELSVSVGLRAIFGSNKYTGTIKDITYRTTAGTIIDVPNDIVLDCKQTGTSLAPIVGIDWRPSKYVNFSARYEFLSHLTLKSKSNNSETFNNLAGSGNPQFAPFKQFLDGAKHKADMPGMLALGTEIQPIAGLRFDFGYNHYFDRATRQWGKSLLQDTNEMVFGAEYDVTDKLTLSAGFQKTFYRQEKENFSDLSFIMSAWSSAVGLEYSVTSNLKLNAGYFHTFYRNHTNTTAVSTTTYSRTSRVFGIGVEYSF
ncbi:MAG: outer membrane protein transport protein [Bacteroidales bacterium]|nr:outer membrane protein transport protein [Bacteroidales bacterium]